METFRTDYRIQHHSRRGLLRSQCPCGNQLAKADWDVARVTFLPVAVAAEPLCEECAKKSAPALYALLWRIPGEATEAERHYGIAPPLAPTTACPLDGSIASNRGLEVVQISDHRALCREASDRETPNLSAALHDLYGTAPAAPKTTTAPAPKPEPSPAQQKATAALNRIATALFGTADERTIGKAAEVVRGLATILPLLQ